LCGKVLDVDNPANSSVLKALKIVAVAVADFFATAGAVMGVSSLLGYSMTFGSACVLTAASLGMTIVIGVPVVTIVAIVSAAVFGQGAFVRPRSVYSALSV
jgi:hypothetical protein